MHIVAIGIDLAKIVFALRGVDAAGKSVLPTSALPHKKFARSPALGLE